MLEVQIIHIVEICSKHTFDFKQNENLLFLNFVDMADYGHSKSKSSNKLKEEKFKSKARNRHHRDSYSKRFDKECKTPPSSTRRSSIEELMKQRKNLKQELKIFTKHSDSDLSDKYSKTGKHRKHSNSYYTYDSDKLRKRHSTNYEETCTAKKKIPQESSPERNGDYAHIESEDEESIIEKRRQQRKKLLETLNVSQNKHDKKNENDRKNQKHKPLYNENNNQNDTTEIKSTSVKETTDMFADKDDFDPAAVPDKVTQDNSEKNAQQLADNWDDSEGYYNVKVGDVVNDNRYMIKSILGKGVFANVVRAQDRCQGNTEVAIKIVRNNELMYKTSLKEIAFLKEISQADPENKYHCVKFLTHFMHKGHLCLVLEPLYMDLRCVIKKYGKHGGINMKALMSYSRQLFVALRLLKKINIVHADIKPDNILVNEKKNVLKLCDFGSASKVDDNEPTPYLVSRFYRAPEIILGICYRHGVDIWSTACTIFEMATGKIMFAGSSNNKMLKCFMDLKGKFPTKMIRKGKFKDQHFNYNNNFLLHKKDEFSGREKFVEVCSINATRDLQKELKKFGRNVSLDEEKKLLQLKDILDKMITIDPGQRLSVNDCLRHPFIQEEMQK